jgi:DNA-binding response OmpR family regulator
MALQVLVIDDEREVNETLGQLLTMEGFDYHYAATGEDGLKLARNLHPDVIVLDAMMPDKTGFDVCRALKSARLTCSIPVLFFTCLCGSDHILRCASVGGQAHVAKPFDFDTVLNLIREADQWHRSTSKMPATGGFRIAATQAEKASKGINQMLCSLITQTAIDDTALAHIGEAFFRLLAATGSLDSKDPSAPKLPFIDVQYTIEPASSMSSMKPGGGGIWWTLTEPAAGMVHAVLNAETKSATTTAVQTSRWMTIWNEFVQSSGISPEPHPSGALRLVRRFQAGAMIAPTDGNVMPFNNFNNSKCHNG